MGDKYQLTLLPSEKSVEIDSETSILDCLRDEGVYIKSGCGGHASCTDCVIKVVEGEGHLNNPTFDETQLLGNVFYITKERLACQTQCHGAVTIDISRHDKVADQMKLANKNSPLPKKNTARVRKKEDVSKMYQERNEKRVQKEEERKLKPQKQSGFQRPKTFRTDHLDKEDTDKKE